MGTSIYGMQTLYNLVGNLVSQYECCFVGVNIDIAERVSFNLEDFEEIPWVKRDIKTSYTSSPGSQRAPGGSSNG